MKIAFCTVVLVVVCDILELTYQHEADSVDGQPEPTWFIYGPSDFEENEMCQVLRCADGELCLVKGDYAECGDEQKVANISGAKNFFRKDKSSASSSKSEKHEEMKDHQRHSVEMGDYPKCTDEELRAVRGRLFKWFGDLHAIQKNEPGYSLPKHEFSCDPDVGFMFNMLDGDKNGRLDISELMSIDKDPYEKCVKSFLDKCDVDHDDDISLNEWCPCFQWSNDEHHEPACHASLRKIDPHDPNAFAPRCDYDGYYELEQCHKNACWCVDKWGRTFDHSKTRGKANCRRFV